jgi:hypothetical protein
MSFSNIWSEQDQFTNPGGSADTASVVVPSMAAYSIGFVLVLLNTAYSSDGLITGITWDGQAMTQAVQFRGGVTSRHAAIFYLVNPPNNGTKNIVVSYIAETARTGLVVSGGADASATVSLDDTSTGSGTGDPVPITSTQAGTNEFVLSGSVSAANALASPSVIDCTLLQAWDSGGNCMVSAYSIPAGSGDVTHQHDYSESEVYTVVSASFSEAGGATSILRQMLMHHEG